MRHHAHYDVTVMVHLILLKTKSWYQFVAIIETGEQCCVEISYVPVSGGRLEGTQIFSTYQGILLI